MRHQRRRSFCFTLALSVLAVGWSHRASAEQVIRLNVPVNVSKLLPEVSHVGITCAIFESEPASLYHALGIEWLELPVADGAVIETVAIDVEPKPNRNFTTASRYECHLHLVRPASDGNNVQPGIESPIVADPSGGADDWNKADGAEPFAIIAEGEIDPGIVQILQGGNQAFTDGE